MAFEHKPGGFSLFKNQDKKSENHPDYRGDGLDLNGNKVQVACWLKKGKNGTFMSCAISPPFEKKEKPDQQEGPSDGIPF